MRRWVVGAAVGLAGLSAPAVSAAPLTQAVTIQFQAFAPAQFDALPGDSVRWSNSSVRAHTVTADDGSFDSGTIGSGGTFAVTFGRPGTYSYHCTIHPSMVGEVDVRRVTLDPLPPAAVPTGQRVALTGRSADGPAPISIERSAPGGYAAVAEVQPRPDGTWSASVAATATADYRAVSGGDVSETRRLLVLDRQAAVRLTRTGLAVTVKPLDPGGVVVLQEYLRERFGWWPVARARLDYVSRAGFRVRGPVRARVVIVDRDGWTPLSISRVVRIPRNG